MKVPATAGENATITTAQEDNGSIKVKDATENAVSQVDSDEANQPTTAEVPTKPQVAEAEVHAKEPHSVDSPDAEAEAEMIENAEHREAIPPAPESQDLTQAREGDANRTEKGDRNKEAPFSAKASAYKSPP